jgi:predicted enzyme related to lactoylglutathione lyase
MANKHGDFIWYELLTDNTDLAQSFYGNVLDWEFNDSGQAEMDYTIITAKASADIGGMLQITPEMRAGGAQPIWLGYIAADDVDACIERIITAGGTEIMPATDIPDIGRLAMVSDPQGALFYIMRGLSDEASLAFAADHPRYGHCAWNELMSSNPAGARSFYGKEFGWIKDGEMDMGPMGTYEFLRHDHMIGAIMPSPEAMPRPMWNYYFRVADIDIAVEKVKAGGGTILTGPDPIPGDEYTIQGLDPQGVVFSLVGQRKAGA